MSSQRAQKSKGGKTPLEERLYHVTRYVKHPRAWCAVIVDTIKSSVHLGGWGLVTPLAGAGTKGQASLQLACQGYVQRLRTVQPGQFSLMLVSLSELDFRFIPCIVKPVEPVPDCIKDVMFALADASCGKHMLPIVRVASGIPSWVLPVDVGYNSRLPGCDVGLALCGCCPAESDFGVMAASCRPVPTTLIAYDQTNYFIEKSAVYQKCLQELRDKYGGCLDVGNYDNVPNMQALLRGMKFMGPDEPGCRQPGFAQPQPGDMKGLDPRIIHAGTYGRKDIVHFQFCLQDMNEVVESQPAKKKQKNVHFELRNQEEQSETEQQVTGEGIRRSGRTRQPSSRTLPNI